MLAQADRALFVMQMPSVKTEQIWMHPDHQLKQKLVSHSRICFIAQHLNNACVSQGKKRHILSVLICFCTLMQLLVVHS